MRRKTSRRFYSWPWWCKSWPLFNLLPPRCTYMALDWVARISISWWPNRCHSSQQRKFDESFYCAVDLDRVGSKSWTLNPIYLWSQRSPFRFNPTLIIAVFASVCPGIQSTAAEIVRGTFAIARFLATHVLIGSSISTSLSPNATPTLTSSSPTRGSTANSPYDNGTANATSLMARSNSTKWRMPIFPFCMLIGISGGNRFFKILYSCWRVQ